MMLSASYMEFCEKRGWNFIEKAPKVAIKHIISVLQPPQLKSRIQDAIELEKSSLEDKYFEFMEYLSEKAVVYEEVLPLRKYRSSSQGSDSKKGKEEKSGRKHPYGTSPSKDRETTLPLCLNKAKCKKRHLVKDCPVTSKEEAKSLLEAYRAMSHRFRCRRYCNIRKYCEFPGRQRCLPAYH